MSFQDFNDDGPGTFRWDFVLGQNTTGMFPDETHYMLEGDLLTEVTFSHTGGGTLSPSEYGESYTVENISQIQKPLFGEQWLSFEQGGCRFRATLNKRFKQSPGCLVVDLEQI